MPIRFARPPAGADAVVQSALDRSATVPVSQRNALAGTEPGRLEPTTPHPVHTLGLTDVVDGSGLDAAPRTGWRYLLREGDGTPVSAEATAGGGDVPEEFSHFNQGPFVASTVAAVPRAENLPEVRDHDYELRTLVIPALHTMALWLHGDDDLLLPLEPVPAGLDADRTYRPDEFLGALRDRARQVPQLAPDDTRGG